MVKININENNPYEAITLDHRSLTCLPINKWRMQVANYFTNHFYTLDIH